MKMAGAIRMVSVSRGHDPRDFALFAFGGAGPLHASALARELGLPRVLVPARPGITNALGCVVADLRHDFVNTLNQPVAALDEARATAILEQHKAAGVELIANEAVRPAEIRFVHSADMQFVGQTHILKVPLPSTAISRGALQALFEAAYFARFKVSLPEIRANLVNLNSSVIGTRDPLDLSTLIDPAGRAASLDGALTRATSGLVRWRVGRKPRCISARNCRWMRSSKAPRSSSNSMRPPSSNPAIGRHRIPTAI